MRRRERARCAREHPWLYAIGLTGVILVPISLLLDRATGSDFGFGFVIGMWPLLVFINVGSTLGATSVWNRRPAWLYGLTAGAVCAAARTAAELVNGSDSTRVLVAGSVAGAVVFVFATLVRRLRSSPR
jgi:hypothetical protein